MVLVVPGCWTDKSCWTESSQAREVVSLPQGLESHAFQLEAQLREARSQPAQPSGAAAIRTIFRFMRRSTEARPQGMAWLLGVPSHWPCLCLSPAFPCPSAAGPGQADMQRQIDKAVEEANAEAEENLNDLLACLGQEERKTERCVLKDFFCILQMKTVMGFQNTMCAGDCVWCLRMGLQIFSATCCRLSERLRELGEDVDALLDGIADAETEEDDEPDLL